MASNASFAFSCNGLLFPYHVEPPTLDWARSVHEHLRDGHLRGVYRTPDFLVAVARAAARRGPSAAIDHLADRGVVDEDAANRCRSADPVPAERRGSLK